MREKPNSQEVSSSGQPTAAETVRALSVFALVRTAFSSERSLMAWMRTSVSLYSFGFTLTKFVDYLENPAPGGQFSQSPRRLGLALICLGILVLVLATVEHWQRLVTMKRLGLPPTSRFPLPVVAAAALFVVGVATLISIVRNWSPL